MHSLIKCFLFAYNKTKSFTLKRFLLITSIILFTTIFAQGQSRLASTTDATGPVMRFYPNPATSIVNFDFQRAYDKGYSMQIYNFLGKKVFEAKNLAQKTTINLAEYNRGLYIYQLRDLTGKMVESGKFQVSK